MRNTWLIAGLSALTVFAACSKDDDPVTPVKTTTELLQHKWTFERQLIVSETNDTVKYTATAADYMDFNTNGKVYTSLDGELDTFNYQLKGSDSLMMDGEYVKIVTIGEQKMTLVSRGGDAIDYEYVWWDLKR